MAGGQLVLFFSAQRSVMSMMMIPLPHYEKNFGKILKSEKNVSEFPPLSDFFRAGAAFQGSSEAVLPSLSKHPGAAPV